MSDDSTKQTDHQSGSIRSKVLIAILAVGLVALAYDYVVARPAVETAYDAITAKSTEVNAKSTEVFTDLDVRKLLGKGPSKTFNDANGDVVEVFSWRSGLPVKTHDLFAIYKPSGGKNLFYRHAKYKYEASDVVSDFSVLKTIESGPVVDDAETEEMDAQYAGGQAGGGGPGGGGPGGGGPGGGQRGGGGWDPEAMFTENDEDGDGFLKDDEISDRMRENLAEIDTDGDGAVSKDEMMARFAQRGGGGGRPGGGQAGGGQAGGGQAGGGQGGGGYSQRPASTPPIEFDDEASTAAGSEPAAQAETDVRPGVEAEAEADAETKAEIEAEAETESKGDEA
jgi:hypothetical protein